MDFPPFLYFCIHCSAVLLLLLVHLLLDLLVAGPQHAGCEDLDVAGGQGLQTHGADHFVLHQLQQLRPAGGELGLRAHGEVRGGDVVAGGDTVGQGVLTLNTKL